MRKKCKKCLCVLTKLFTYLTLVISAATTRCLSSRPAICGTKNKSVTPSWEEGQGCRQEIEEDTSSGPAVVVPPPPSHDVRVKVTLVVGDCKCWRRLACFIVSRSCVSFSLPPERKSGSVTCDLDALFAAVNSSQSHRLAVKWRRFGSTSSRVNCRQGSVPPVGATFSLCISVERKNKHSGFQKLLKLCLPHGVRITRQRRRRGRSH